MFFHPGIVFAGHVLEIRDVSELSFFRDYRPEWTDKYFSRTKLIVERVGDRR